MKLTRLRGWFAAAGVVWGTGCVSNPTPHPSVETSDTSRGDDMNDNTPTDEDGCVDVGGVWDGTACFGIGDGDTMAPEHDVEVSDSDVVDTMDGIDVPETQSDGDPGPGDDTEP